MKIVLTYGTFDLLHYGHILLFKRLKSMGDKLYVGVSTDDFNTMKGKSSILNYNERCDLVKSIAYIDFIFPERTWEQKVDDIVKYKVNLFGIGDDWRGKFDFLKIYCDVVYIPRTPKISSSVIKKNIMM